VVVKVVVKLNFEFVESVEFEVVPDHSVIHLVDWGYNDARQTRHAISVH
jgi:hypothetical protein